MRELFPTVSEGKLRRIRGLLSYRVGAKHRQAGQPRGRGQRVEELRHDRTAGPSRQRGYGMHDVLEPIVDQRIHADHMIELTQRRVEHVADAELDAPRAMRRRRALPGETAAALNCRTGGP